MLLTIVVNTTADTPTFDKNISGPTVSLREAINHENFGFWGGDTITFDPSLAGTMITLNQGELVVRNSLTITGPGASQLTIEGSGLSRIFDLNGSANSHVTITGLTLEGGYSYGPSDWLHPGVGGAIYNSETLTLANDVISNNNAINGGGIYNDIGGNVTSTNDTFSINRANNNGGGIYNNGGNVTSTSDEISYNVASNNGGGIYNKGGNFTSTRDVIDYNTAYNDGGGISNDNGGSLTSSRDKIWWNLAFDNGGGISNDNSGRVALHSDTVYTNTAYNNGGGISNNNGGTLASNNVTITRNTGQVGGGIWSQSTLSYRNSIILGNNESIGLDIDGSVLDDRGNVMTGSPSSVLNYLDLVAGSPAIGAAVELGHVTATGDSGFSSLAVDDVTYIVAGDYLKVGTELLLVQSVTSGFGTTGTLTVARGQCGTSGGQFGIGKGTLNGLPIWLAADSSGALVNSNSNDAGAVAARHAQQQILVVNTLLDNVNDANISGPTVTLREAINFANTDLGAYDEITFAPSLTASGPVTITLNGTALAITNSMTIAGPGANQLIIDGNNTSRIFDLNGTPSSDVTISGLTLQHGYSTGAKGGAIDNRESLTLADDVITENTATYGGGIYNHNNDASALDEIWYAQLWSNHDSITGNTATYGGGIYNDGSLTSTIDTISGNFATTNNGGGIYNAAYLTSTNDNINLNNAFVNGGGIYNDGYLSLTGNKILENNATNGGGFYNAIDGYGYSTNNTFTGNTGTASGGGIYNHFGGILWMPGDKITGNTAFDGGGMCNDGTANSTSDSFTGNTAKNNGGGIDNTGTLTLDGATISGNGATNNGGGIFNDVGGSLTSSISTIKGNSAASGGGFSNRGTFVPVNDTISENISEVTATITVTPYTVIYDGKAHSATCTALGANGEDLSGDLTLDQTTHTDAGQYINDTWTFHDPTGNYADASGKVTDVISQITAKITVTPYSVTYDGASHSATGTATGFDGIDLRRDLTLTGTTHTNAGTYNGDTWTFHDPSGVYADASGTVNDVISGIVPVITTQPVSTNVTAGSTASFSASATGTPTPTVQWQVSLDNGTTWNNVTGATTATYNFTTTASENNWQFRAVFTNVVGTATTNAVNLSVGTAPVVSTQPTNITVISGATASFTAKASGTPTPAVQWQVSVNNGSTWTNVTGATSSTYSFTTSATDNAKQYRAVFTNSVGSVTTAPAVLSVTPSSISANVIGVGVKWGTSGSAALVDANGGTLLPGGRTVDIPWANINQISITLNHSVVSLNPSDVSVSGSVGGNYGPVTVTGSGTSWTITLAKAVASADKVTVAIGNSELTSYQRIMNVLPGDFNDDGAVTSADVTLVNSGISAPYNVFADFNGDGLVDSNDLKGVRGKVGTKKIV